MTLKPETGHHYGRVPPMRCVESSHLAPVLRGLRIFLSAFGWPSMALRLLHTSGNPLRNHCCWIHICTAVSAAIALHQSM